MNMLKQWTKCSGTLLLVMLSLTACGTSSPAYKIDCDDSKVLIPALDSSLRQESGPQWCSPTCTQAVAEKDRNSQSLLIQLMPEG